MPPLGVYSPPSDAGLARNPATGFRGAECPSCRQRVNVVSRLDDTRWRFELHAGAPDAGRRCPGSGELVWPG